MLLTVLWYFSQNFHFNRFSSHLVHFYTACFVQESQYNLLISAIRRKIYFKCDIFLLLSTLNVSVFKMIVSINQIYVIIVTHLRSLLRSWDLCWQVSVRFERGKYLKISYNWSVSVNAQMGQRQHDGWFPHSYTINFKSYLQDAKWIKSAVLQRLKSPTRVYTTNCGRRLILNKQYVLTVHNLGISLKCCVHSPAFIISSVISATEFTKTRPTDPQEQRFPHSEVCRARVKHFC